MSEQPPASPQSTTLRERAEKAFREMLDNSPENLDALSPETLRTSLHELRVHQIELEMQNEDLLRAQADLGATRARYFDLYDLAPVGYCTVSEKGLILEANLTAATLLHQKRDTLVGRGLSAFISKEDQELYYLCRKKLLDTRQPQECDLRMVRPDDTAFFAHLKITYACDENEEPVCHIALIDITGVKELENTLRESEMHFRTLADSGQALIWTSGIDKKCNYFNRVWLDFTGRSLEQELGDGWAEGVHPDDLDSCFRTYVEAFDRRTPFNMDYRLRRHDGEYRWLQDQGTPRYSSDGDFLGYIGHCLDITDRKQTEEFLRESESRYAQLAEQSLTVAWEVDAQGLYTYVSQVSETVSGYRPDELVGRKHFYDLHPESGREEFKASAFAVFARKQPFVNLVNALQTKDGRQVWVSTNGAPLLNAEGTLCGYRGGDTDITKREKAETLLRASEARFRSFFELPLHGRCITSPEKGWLEVNDRLCEILGYTGEEILQKTWAEMTHPGDLAADVAQFDRLLSGEIEQYKLEKRFVRKDGSTVWTEISVGGVRKSDGTVDHLICVMEDITERIKAVLELGVLEEHHRDILQTAMDGFCQLDTEGRIQSVNASFCRMTGYSEEELMTMGISDLEAVMTPGNVASNIRKIIAKGGVRFETRHRCKDGKVIDVEVSVQFRPHDNTLVSFHHDITKRKEMDAKILVALDRAESANRAKSDFLGVMSHELCTPLSLIHI